MMNTDLELFLEKHDYVVKAFKKGPNQCEVFFPDGTLITYAYDRLGVLVGSPPEIYTSPAYLLRLVVETDILRRMRQLKIPNNLIKYFDIDGQSPLSDLSEIFSDPSDETDRIKESFLIVLLKDGFNHMAAKVAESHQVGFGYMLLKGLS